MKAFLLVPLFAILGACASTSTLTTPAERAANAKAERIADRLASRSDRR